jgi:hypothetical protein
MEEIGNTAYENMMFFLPKMMSEKTHVLHKVTQVHYVIIVIIKLAYKRKVASHKT